MITPLNLPCKESTIFALVVASIGSAALVVVEVMTASPSPGRAAPDATERGHTEMTAPAHRLLPVVRDRVRVRTPLREQNCIHFSEEVNPRPEPACLLLRCLCLRLRRSGSGCVALALQP